MSVGPQTPETTPVSPRPEDNVIDYAPVSTVAVLAIPIALGSLIAALLPHLVYLLPLPGVALLLAWWSRRRIKRSEGALAGSAVSIAAIVVAGLSVALTTTHAVAYYYTVVPEGYEMLTFHDLRELRDERQFTPKLLDAVGKNIQIKGYMLPTRQTRDITEFTLVRDAGNCCFGGAPKPWDMVAVEMAEDKSADLIRWPVRVGGIFAVNTSDPNLPPFSLKAEYVK